MVNAKLDRPRAYPVVLAMALAVGLSLIPSHRLLLPAPAQSQEREAPLSQEQALSMLQAGVSSQQVAAFARKDGVDFKVTPALERELRKAGATDSLIQLLKKLGNAQPPAAPSAPAGTSELAPLLKTAEDALTRKDFSAAAKALEAVVAKQPQMPAAWFDLGYAYNNLDRPDDAVHAYRKSVELAPEQFPARLNLGMLLLAQKQPQAALEQLQKATALKPDNPRAHLYYAQALSQTGQPDSARKELQEAIRLDPRLTVAQLELGQLELQQKQPADALAAFEQALAAEPNLVQAELGAGMAAEALNQPAQAITHFEKYLTEKPDDVETRYHLAHLYLAQKQDEKARVNLENVYQVEPNLPGLAAALGDVNARLKKLPDAEKYDRLAIASQPSVPELHRDLGQVLLDEQKFPEAEAEFRTALQLDPHDRDAAIGLASSLDLQKRYGEAIPILEELAKAPDAAPYTFFVLATCYDQLRIRKKALADYEHFLSLSHGMFPDQEWQATQRAKLLRRELSK